MKKIHKALESPLKTKNMDFRVYLLNDVTGDVTRVVEGQKRLIFLKTVNK